MAVTTERAYSGYRIQGEQQGITLSVSVDGLIRVGVYVPAAAVPGDHGIDLTHELPKAFAPHEVVLSGGRLSCLTTPPWPSAAAFFSEGFQVALEPAMPAAVGAALEKLVPLAAEMAAIYKNTDRLLALRERAAGSFNYLDGPAESLVAMVRLDGLSIREALDIAFERASASAPATRRARYTIADGSDEALFLSALVVATEIVLNDAKSPVDPWLEGEAAFWKRLASSDA